MDDEFWKYLDSSEQSKKSPKIKVENEGDLESSDSENADDTDLRKLINFDLSRFYTQVGNLRSESDSDSQQKFDSLGSEIDDEDQNLADQINSDESLSYELSSGRSSEDVVVDEDYSNANIQAHQELSENIVMQAFNNELMDNLYIEGEEESDLSEAQFSMKLPDLLMRGRMQYLSENSPFMFNY